MKVLNLVAVKTLVMKGKFAVIYALREFVQSIKRKQRNLIGLFVICMVMNPGMLQS